MCHRGFEQAPPRRCGRLEGDSDSLLGLRSARLLSGHSIFDAVVFKDRYASSGLVSNQSASTRAARLEICLRITSFAADATLISNRTQELGKWLAALHVPGICIVETKNGTVRVACGIGKSSKTCGAGAEKILDKQACALAGKALPFAYRLWVERWPPRFWRNCAFYL